WKKVGYSHFNEAHQEESSKSKPITIPIPVSSLSSGKTFKNSSRTLVVFSTAMLLSPEHEMPHSARPR
ncbi:hypothetical protein EC957_009594, partial [Mortierella hygrophila]